MQKHWLAFIAAAALAATTVFPAAGQEKPKPKVAIPDAGVPQAGSIEGKFVRAVWNNEAYIVMGYQVAQRSMGDERMMLDLGTTVLDKTPEYKLRREHISVTTPDNKTIPIMTVEEFRKADVRVADVFRRDRQQDAAHRAVAARAGEQVEQLEERRLAAGRQRDVLWPDVPPVLGTQQLRECGDEARFAARRVVVADQPALGHVGGRSPGRAGGGVEGRGDVHGVRPV